MTTILPTAIVFVLIVSVASALRADILTSEQKDFYREHNAILETIRINDDSGLDVDAAGNNITLASLFNEYFGTDYASSQALFDELGVKEIVSTWTVNENARIEASFKSAALAQTLSIIDSLGNAVASQTFAGGIFGDRLGGEPIRFDVAGLYHFSLDTGENVFSASNSNDGLIHLIAFDVTALMQAKLPDEQIDSAYLFCWEDLNADHWYADFDFQDLSYIMINVTPNTVTPEPSTFLIMGIGGAGFLLLRKRSAAGSTQAMP